ncbi:hypothetical protein [Nocardiopsis sp. CC223A]|uniref:hypothetical protein n=1 Tax=Nocardiopsis sp. CC223A TaxID=3044051 RepID=UPI00278C5259|nr:hypothetical protein [Nocardiopsis sp. CC223A]
MTDQPYDVDADLGDDPQESEIAETESRMDAAGYTFEDEDAQDRGGTGISEEVRREEPPVLEREDWSPDEPGPEADALHEEDDDGRWTS